MRNSFMECPFFIFREEDEKTGAVMRCGDGQFIVGGSFPAFCAKGEKRCPVAQFIRKMKKRGEKFYLWLRVEPKKNEGTTSPQG